MAPPITYEIECKQYVAFMAGSGRPAASIGPNDAKIDNPPMLFVFGLKVDGILHRIVLGHKARAANAARRFARRYWHIVNSVFLFMSVKACACFTIGAESCPIQSCI